MTLINSLLFAVCIFSVSSALCHANEFYAAGHNGSDGLSTFYSIDPDNGTQTTIGPIGFERCGSMDFRPRTNLLYALCERADGSNTGVLITIDLSTGAGTEIGPTGINGAISDISFRNSDNVLFAENVSGQHTLYTINIHTGEATIVGITGLSSTGGNGMSVDRADTLFLQTTEDENTPELYEMNQTTGQAQFLKNISFPPPNSVQDRFKALDNDPRSDVMFGIYSKRVDDGPDLTFLGILNIASGNAEEIVQVTNDLDALAILVIEPNPIPTLSEWGLIAMAGVLGIIGLFAIRRRWVAD